MNTEKGVKNGSMQGEMISQDRHDRETTCSPRMERGVLINAETNLDKPRGELERHPGGSEQFQPENRMK